MPMPMTGRRVMTRSDSRVGRITTNDVLRLTLVKQRDFYQRQGGYGWHGSAGGTESLPAQISREQSTYPGG